MSEHGPTATTLRNAIPASEGTLEGVFAEIPDSVLDDLALDGLCDCYSRLRHNLMARQAKRDRAIKDAEQATQDCERTKEAIERTHRAMARLFRREGKSR